MTTETVPVPKVETASDVLVNVQGLKMYFPVTAGLIFPLRGETLEPGSSRGVSNAFASPTARIEDLFRRCSRISSSDLRTARRRSSSGVW